MAKEDQLSFQKPSANFSSSVLGAVHQQGGISQAIQLNSVPDQTKSGDGTNNVATQSGQQQQGNNQAAFGSNVNQFLLNLSQSSNTAQATNGAMPFEQGSAAGLDGTANTNSDAKASVAKGPKVIVKSGRKSDPRMDYAVQAKLDDPSLPLLDALRQGGFIFPALDDASTPQYTVVDSDNVKITQRKNQLLRRIRTAKKKVG